ncbi:MAG: 1-phosphofructokinase family hexose kinase [Megasphaera sp.]|jgi:tagatose 6-phosphate kinase|nr:1-phosphofructokinase family hexose kinase [Megasphaera sp.]
MILVVNLNASLDKKYELRDLKKGTVMRAASVQNTPGGKGLHVANIVKTMGIDCIATGFLAGHNGAFIEEQLEHYGIRHDFVHLDEGETRCCLACITDDGAQTEILEPGPSVSQEKLDEFLRTYDTYLDTVDGVAASGSLPGNVPLSLYGTMITMAKKKHVPFFLDTSGQALCHGIDSAPYFIKPNEEEIQAYTGRTVTGIDDLKTEIKHFISSGIGVAVVSLGSKGALAGNCNGIYRVQVPVITAVNPVGSGDSFVGGFLAAYSQQLDFPTALTMAAACGTANAMEEETAVVNKDTVYKLMDQIIVQKEI